MQSKRMTGLNTQKRKKKEVVKYSDFFFFTMTKEKRCISTNNIVNPQSISVHTRYFFFPLSFALIPSQIILVFYLNIFFLRVCLDFGFSLYNARWKEKKTHFSFLAGRDTEEEKNWKRRRKKKNQNKSVLNLEHFFVVCVYSEAKGF